MSRLLLLLLLLPGLAEAAGVMHAAGSELRDADRAAAATAAGTGDATALVVQTPAAAWLAAGATVGAERQGTVMALSEQLAAAREQLTNLQTAEAMAGLRQAISSLPSSSAAVDPADLHAALELLGQAAQDEGQEEVARAAYRQLLAASPAARLSTPPGTGYEEVFDAVRNEVNALGRPVFALRHARREVRWDGEPLEARWSGSQPIAPGRHLLQWSDGLGWQGAWVDVPDDAPAVVLLATDGSIEELLAAGAVDEGHRAALVGWLGTLDPDVVVVQGLEPLRGYRVTGGQIASWSGAARTVAAPPADLDRVRVLVGGGYGFVDGSSYGELGGALGVRLIGPLSLRIDGGVGISEPLDFGPGHALTGRVALLPGVGVGPMVQLPTGPAQPFAALSLGVWIVPADQRADAEAEASRLDATLSDQLSARGPVGFRGYLDGGVDLLPAGPLVLRLWGGVGYGYGFQARGGVRAGVRL